MREKSSFENNNIFILNLKKIPSVLRPGEMSAPSKAGGVTSISENEGNFQHNTLGLGEEEAVRSTEVEMFSHETFRTKLMRQRRI